MSPHFGSRSTIIIQDIDALYWKRAVHLLETIETCTSSKNIMSKIQTDAT